MPAAFLQNLSSVGTVLLNQAALYKSQLTELPLRLSDLAARCHMGALEIATTVRNTSNVHVTYQCAYNAFCIYVGSRVFVEMLRQPAPSDPHMAGPTRESLQSDLNMMLAALQTFTEHVPLAGHFLMQLEADLNGLENVVSLRPYDVKVGYSDCHVCSAQYGVKLADISRYSREPVSQLERVLPTRPMRPMDKSLTKPGHSNHINRLMYVEQIDLVTPLTRGTIV